MIEKNKNNNNIKRKKQRQKRVNGDRSYSERVRAT